MPAFFHTILCSNVNILRAVVALVYACREADKQKEQNSEFVLDPIPLPPL